MRRPNIALVGFMGTGKSSVGKVLAKKTGRKLVDIDRDIETAEKKKIAQIFASEGEAHFRRVEKEMIARAAAAEGVVITTGGGAVTDPANLAALKEGGVVVALWATPETVYRRVKDSKNRPLLDVEDVPAEIRRLLDLRKPFYEKADYHFHTDGRTASQVAGSILDQLKEVL